MTKEGIIEDPRHWQGLLSRKAASVISEKVGTSACLLLQMLAKRCFYNAFQVYYFKHGSYVFKHMQRGKLQIHLKHIKENAISLGVQTYIKPLNNLKGT